jgi:hypothetical protein
MEETLNPNAALEGGVKMSISHTFLLFFCLHRKEIHGKNPNPGWDFPLLFFF